MTIAKTLTRIALWPVGASFWVVGKILAPVGEQRYEGMLIGAAAMTLALGIVRANAEQQRIPLTEEDIIAMQQAEIDGETPWDGPMELVLPLPRDPEDEIFEAEVVPIPGRKPPVPETAYSDEDRNAMNDLIERSY